jgi:hypothetical protein
MPSAGTCDTEKYLRPLGFCYRHQQLIGSEFRTNFHALALLAMCNFLRSLYCHNISVGNLQTLSVKGSIQLGYQTREVKLGRSFQCISLNILLVGKSLK